MRDVGPLIASGRDADIFDFGPGLVLRRTTTGRSLEVEARVMEYARGCGYPVPRVHDVAGSGRDLVMDRVDGPSMLDAMAARPWTIGRQGRALAALHRSLHSIPAPEWVAPAGAGTGATLVHQDLHPMNVLLGPDGPVVIDWSNAAAGTADGDVALSWALMAAGRVEGGAPRRALTLVARRWLVRSFLSGVDRAGAAAALTTVVTWKAHDPHMSTSEVTAMRALASRESRA
ncbi:MAG: phosphotransferase [Acidimicrobiales bacterium]